MLAPHPDTKSDGSHCNSVTSIFVNHLFNHMHPNTRDRAVRFPPLGNMGLGTA